MEDDSRFVGGSIPVLRQYLGCTRMASRRHAGLEGVNHVYPRALELRWESRPYKLIEQESAQNVESPHHVKNALKASQQMALLA